jgi:hypothetical protein
VIKEKWKRLIKDIEGVKDVRPWSETSRNDCSREMLRQAIV